MHSIIAQSSSTCRCCVARGIQRRAKGQHGNVRRSISSTLRRLESLGGKHEVDAQQPAEKGAMFRRLEAMTEQSLEEGGRGAGKAVDDAGFSAELKKQLEERITTDRSRQLNPAASAVLSMPESAGAATRDAAVARPWIGIETPEDASLRMLQDAHKPLRFSGGGGRVRRAASPRLSSLSVDARLKQSRTASKGERLANARDKTSIYAISQDANLTDKEKEEMRRILKERFQPGARSMPATLQGLSSLANERIEDAIARGKFKDIPRGKGVGTKVDHGANSLFIDTTEYFMNKMLQRQDIVPPWIEKQQEVIKMVGKFRQRLRNDWKRHAARSIASRGGSLDDQVCRAEAYAVAEAELNPKVQKVEAFNRVNDSGKITQVNIVEALNMTNDGVDSKITIVETPAGHGAARVAVGIAASDTTPLANHAESNQCSGSVTQVSPALAKPPQSHRRTPFRDPRWEEIEFAYHSAALKELNNLTRTYNLMAPEAAKKPYCVLERELMSCFADVAPELAGEIRERARRPEKIRVEAIGHTPGSVLERFAGKSVNVYDSRRPTYGLKEFWRELWKNGGEERRV